MHLPYVICALDYRTNSMGIKVLHRLCKMLNDMGFEAYMNVEKTLKGVPTIFGQREKLLKLIVNGAIVVYPESQNTNYLWSKNPVGWNLLPGKFYFEREGLIFSYDSLCGDAERLTIIDVEDYFKDDKNYKRKFNVVYTAKGFIPEVIKSLDNVVVMDWYWPRDRKKLAKILKQAKAFHFFANTALSAEARLCGCPAILHENGENTLESLKTGFATNLGLTNSTNPDKVEEARKECKAFYENWKRQEYKNESEVARFIKITQEWAIARMNGKSCADRLGNN